MSIRAALDSLASLESFSSVHLACETGPIAAGVYSAMRTSPQISVCLEGEVNYWVRRDGAAVPLVLRSGEAVVLPGGVWIAVEPRQHYRTLGISLFPEMIHCYLVQPGRAGEPHVTGGRSRSFADLRDNTLPAGISPKTCEFERIDYLDELDRPSVPDQTIEQLIATLAINGDRSPADPLLNLILKAVVLRLREAITASHMPVTSKAEATFNRIRRFIVANCDRPLDRDEIAAAIGVHPRHVSNLFNRFGEETLSNFLLRARLERARRLLAVSDTPVTEVARMCGFAGANHFVRTFRQRFGSPPGKYRNATHRIPEVVS